MRLEGGGGLSGYYCAIQYRGRNMSEGQDWDYSFDVVVVGSGNGGMTAALCTYEMGTKDVLVIEKSDLYGGTSSISGGGVWIPGNRYAREAGAEDSVDKARTYLRQLITTEEVPDYQLAQVGPGVGNGVLDTGFQGVAVTGNPHPAAGDGAGAAIQV